MRTTGSSISPGRIVHGRSDNRGKAKRPICVHRHYRLARHHRERLTYPGQDRALSLRGPTRLKAQQILLEMWECPPQRWTPLNLRESSPASIRPTLKRQKVVVRGSDQPEMAHLACLCRL